MLQWQKKCTGISIVMGQKQNNKSKHLNKWYNEEIVHGNSIVRVKTK